MQVPKHVLLAYPTFDRDVLHCIAFDRNISEEWLSCLMHTYGQGFGVIANNA
jgi:hypothetical protein